MIVSTSKNNDEHDIVFFTTVAVIITAVDDRGVASMICGAGALCIERRLRGQEDRR